jgi:hypothetical protein
MSKILLTSVLALGVGLASMTSGDAAVGSSGARAAPAPIETVQLAQQGSGNPAVRGTVRAAPRVVAPRLVQPGIVGRPLGVGRPVGIGRPLGVGRPVGIGRPLVVGRPFVRAYRPFYRRPWFGTVIGGIALGTFLTVATVGVAPAYAPAPGLCWYWADPSLTQGYWDYCQPPY